MAANKNAKKQQKSKPIERSEEKTKLISLSTISTFLIGLFFGGLHMYHVSTLYENEKSFSLLSTMEREMSFRTEMGLYYSYFKTMLEADSGLKGLASLYANNITEYPNTINVLKRFNVYPELILGLIYRLADGQNWLQKTCWPVNRGEGLSPVESCEGLGDPAYFYVDAVWLFAGLTAFILFVLATFISSSKVGGLLAITCFFYNHEECTRVMWTPPLRESFGYPLSLLQITLVSWTLNSRNSSNNLQKSISIAILTTLYLLSWQFAQFTLFSQVCIIFVLNVLGFLEQPSNVKTVFYSLMIGLLLGVLCLLMNEMLLTSWLFSGLLVSIVFLKIEEKTSLNRTKSPFIRLCAIPAFLGATFSFKAAWSRALQVQDDAHVLNLLKAKLIDYQDFDTLLYTCAKEFDFLGWEMPYKTTVTLLLPSSILVIFLVLFHWLKSSLGSSRVAKERKPEEEEEPYPINAAIWYNLGQTGIYAIMAVGIMRLKLFLTPHLCIIVALLAKDKFLPGVQTRKLQLTLVFALLAAMSVGGYANLQKSYSRLGEYSNPSMEELFEWVNKNTSPEASFAGPMPVMANLLLSTRRPIINHPHYEDVALRERTRKVYQMYSCWTPTEYYNTLREMKANYVLLASPWCLDESSSKCSMLSVMKAIEPARGGEEKALCPTLFHSPNPTPFQRAFANDEYVLLQL